MLNLFGHVDWFVILSVTKQLKLSEECRVDRSLSHTIICFFGQRDPQTAADSTHDKGSLGTLR